MKCTSGCTQKTNHISAVNVESILHKKKTILIRHLSTYTVENKYICCHCVNLLARTLWFQDTHRNYKYQWGQCAKFFKQKSVIEMDFRTHTENKPNNCSQCAKYFTQETILTRHFSTYTWENTYIYCHFLNLLTRTLWFQNTHRKL